MSGTATRDQLAPSHRSTNGSAASSELRPMTPTAHPSAADRTEIPWTLLRPLPNCGTGSDPQAGSLLSLPVGAVEVALGTGEPKTPGATYPNERVINTPVMPSRTHICGVIAPLYPGR